MNASRWRPGMYIVSAEPPMKRVPFVSEARCSRITGGVFRKAGRQTLTPTCGSLTDVREAQCRRVSSSHSPPPKEMDLSKCWCQRCFIILAHTTSQDPSVSKLLLHCRKDQERYLQVVDAICALFPSRSPLCSSSFDPVCRLTNYSRLHLRTFRCLADLRSYSTQAMAHPTSDSARIVRMVNGTRSTAGQIVAGGEC